MQQRVRDVSVLERKYKTFVTCVCMLAVMPVFCALAVATGVSALSLPRIVEDVAAPVIKILPEKTTPAQPAAPLHSSRSPQSASVTTTTVTMPTNDTTTDAVYSVGEGAPLEPILSFTQDLQQINTQPRRGAQLIAVHSARTPQSGSFAILQPSEQGWQIAGIAWYWWVVAGVAIWLGWRLLLRRAREQPLVG